jgi:hypothetical protein
MLWLLFPWEVPLPSFISKETKVTRKVLGLVIIIVLVELYL